MAEKDTNQGKPKKRVPVGTKNSPWYFVSEHVQNGKTIPAHYTKITPSGVWKVVEVPKGSIVKKDTTY